MSLKFLDYGAGTAMVTVHMPEQKVKVAWQATMAGGAATAAARQAVRAVEQRATQAAAVRGPPSA